MSHLLPAGGGGYIQGGSEIFLVMYFGGVENKMTHGQGRSCILSGIGGGGGQMCSIGLSFH